MAANTLRQIDLGRFSEVGVYAIPALVNGISRVRLALPQRAVVISCDDGTAVIGDPYDASARRLI